MNDGVRVVVHAYAGDAHQVVAALPQYDHHAAPLTVLSPEDAPVDIPGVDCRKAGRRAYTGQVSLDRQRAHLELLLDYEEEWFLLHDSDSVCLEPELPGYLYEADTLFYNATPTHRYLASLGEPPMPDYAYVFQPPLFCSRSTIERMLQVSDEAMRELPPFAKLIDWWFCAGARLAGLDAKPFPDGISRPIWSQYEVARVYAMVRTRGFIFIHSVKSREVLDVLVSARAEHQRDPAADELSRTW